MEEILDLGVEPDVSVDDVSVDDVVVDNVSVDDVVVDDVVADDVVADDVVEDAIIEGLEDFTLEDLELGEGGAGQLETVNNLLKDLREGKVSAKDIIKDMIDDERKLSVERAEGVAEIIKNPPKGIDIKEMSQWLSTQPEEFKKIANSLTSGNLPPETIRNGLEMLKLFRTKGKTIGDPTQIGKKPSITRESLITEYENIIKTKYGYEKKIAMEKLVEKGTSTNNEDLISFTKQMFS